MQRRGEDVTRADRRGFLKRAGAGLTSGLLIPALSSTKSLAASDPISHAGVQRPLTDKEKVARIASNSWPIRYIFKARGVVMAPAPEIEQMKKKYGEITMLDFPNFTKETFPGVRDMDLFSGLFGDPADDSQFVKVSVADSNGATHEMTEFDPSSAAGKRWLGKIANMQVVTGTDVTTSRTMPRATFVTWMPKKGRTASTLLRSGWMVRQPWARSPCVLTAAARASLRLR